ncbi:hypothetical protein ILUMI_21184, partial [Ignelater luminosus]
YRLCYVMQKAEKRLNAILRKSKNSGIPVENLKNLDVVQTIYHLKHPGNRKRYVFAVLTGFLFALAIAFNNSECLIELPQDSSKIFREPENCDICIGVDHVNKVQNISPADFEDHYVAKGRPVVITDGTKGWSAVNTFTFEFFKELYQKTNRDGFSKTECQFFPYKTEFKSLEEALNMSSARSRLELGTLPWYIGWSNCNDEAGKILRKHYDRPYFLPEKSENIALNWIFMGGPGFGAHMHVDNVQYPSWQAQLRGQKIWKLAPPPECFYKCHELQVTVAPGEIIVVDTNRWYHQTYIPPGDISITIGAEFD